MSDYRHHKKYGSEKNKKTIAAVICSVVVFFCAVLFFVSRWEKKISYSDADPYIDEEEMNVNYNGQWYAPNDRIETVLVIGLDKFTGQVKEYDDTYVNEQQADFIMLIIIDKENEKITPVHINRDTMADIQVLGIDGSYVDTVTAQLAISHSYGTGKQDSCRNTVKAVSGLLYGVPIDHYASVTMDAVETVNDMAGGVTLEILDDFSGVDDTLIKGETMTLTGEHALTYIRSRAGMEDPTNLNRMERQRQYMNALYEACLEKYKTDADFAAKALLKINEHLVSDCTVTMLQKYADEAAVYTVEPIREIEGKAVKGEKFMEFYPDEKALKETVLELFYVPAE